MGGEKQEVSKLSNSLETEPRSRPTPKARHQKETQLPGSASAAHCPTQASTGGREQRGAQPTGSSTIMNCFMGLRKETIQYPPGTQRTRKPPSQLTPRSWCAPGPRDSCERTPPVRKEDVWPHVQTAKEPAPTQHHRPVDPSLAALRLMRSSEKPPVCKSASGFLGWCQGLSFPLSSKGCLGTARLGILCPEGAEGRGSFPSDYSVSRSI